MKIIRFFFFLVYKIKIIFKLNLNVYICVSLFPENLNPTSFSYIYSEPLVPYIKLSVFNYEHRIPDTYSMRNYK